MARNLAREECAVARSYVFAGVGGYYASKQSGLAGVFRCATDDANWKLDRQSGRRHVGVPRLFACARDQRAGQNGGRAGICFFRVELRA
jgi:hypothetical protein